MSIAVRTRLIHGYLCIGDDMLWSLVRDELVALGEGLTNLLATHS